MKYERLASATGVGLSLVMLAGCSSGEQDVHRSEAVMPPAIARQVGGHILQLVYEGDAKDKQITTGTAVRVHVGKDRTIDITAAHNLERSQKNCADETLYRKTNDKGVETFTPTKQSPIEQYLQAGAQSTSDHPELAGNDAAGIINGSNADHYGGIRPMEHIDIQTGAKMTLVNYQNAPSGKSRDVQQPGKYGDVAAFDATYIGMEGTKMVALTGGGESYGSIDDHQTRDGASGGAAFINDARGSFVGITTNGSNSTVTSKDIQERFGVSMEAPKGAHLTFIEPITANDAEVLYQQAVNQPDCTSQGW